MCADEGKPRPGREPRWLYRYLRMPAEGQEPHEENLKRLLIHDEIHFSSPLNFNDPFDSTCLFRMKGSTPEDWERYLRMNGEEGTDDEIRSQARELARGAATGWGAARDRLHGVMLAGLEEVRVICLSERWDSMLMWAHYADGHRGLCLQFDRATLSDRWWCAKVRYRRDYPSLREFLDTSPGGPATAEFLLLNKATQWRYEREWRAIAFTFAGKTNPVALPDGALRGVLFGSLMSENDKSRLLRWIGQRQRTLPLQVLSARRHTEEYRLIRSKYVPIVRAEGDEVQSPAW